MKNEHLRELLTERERVLASRLAMGAGFASTRPSEGDLADCMFAAWGTGDVVRIARARGYAGPERRADAAEHLRRAGVETIDDSERSPEEW